MGSVGNVVELLKGHESFEPEKVEFLTSDDPTARRIMTNVIKQRTVRKAREFTSCFGLIFKQGRFSWMRWDCLVDLIQERFCAWLGVSGRLISNVRQLTFAMKGLSDVFTTSLKRAENHTVYTAPGGTVSVRRKPEALFDWGWKLRTSFYEGELQRRRGPILPRLVTVCVCVEVQALPNAG